jgi:radical SAM protein with 4Fe4S-binding SPASM domain
MYPYVYRLVKNRLSKRSVIPLEVILFVTERCNLSCAHCFIEEKDKTPEGDELSLEEFGKLSRGIPQLISLMITGGEPFLRDDLADILKLFDRNSNPKVISIITNGYLTDRIKDQLDRILESPLKARLILTLSLDGDEATHNDMRRNSSSYKMLRATMRMLKAHPFRNRFLLGLNITYCKDNERVPWQEYKKVFDEAGGDFLSINLARVLKGDKEFTRVDMDGYADIAGKINRYNKIKISGLNALARFLHGTKEKYQTHLVKRIYAESRYQGIVCEAGRNIIVICPNGDVYPCELIREKLGSVRQETLGSILARPENIVISKRIRENKCFCHHECFLSASINLNLTNQLRSLRWYFFNRRR